MRSEPAIVSEIARLRARAAQLQGEIQTAPPTPVGDETVGCVAFSFASPPMQIFGGIPVGAVFSAADIIVTEPFNAPAAAQLGPSGDLSLLLGASDSRLQAVGEYQSDAVIVAAAADVLVFSLTTNGATAGRGYVFYRMLA